MWSISLPIMIFLFIDLTASFAVRNVEPNSLHSLFRVRRTYIDENENCGRHDFEMVHTIMDRICMLCHELQSHIEPNTRVECMKECFQNTVFRSCMQIFSGKPRNTATRHHHIEPTAPVPLYTEEVQTLDDIKERRKI